MKRPVLLGLVFVCAAAVTSAALFAQQSVFRTLFVSVVTRDGTPVSTVQVGDLAVMEDGRARRIDRVSRAATPPTVAVIVHDRGAIVPDAAEGISQFVNTLPADARIGIFSTSFVEWTVVDFTANRRALTEGIRALVPPISGASTRSSYPKQSAVDAPSPTTMQQSFDLEGLIRHILAGFHRKSVERPVIALMSFEQGCIAMVMGKGSKRCGTPSLDNMNWDLAVRELQKTRTLFYSLGHAPNHANLIDSSSRLSGGWVDFDASPGRISHSMVRIGKDIAGQYAVTYIAPPAPKDGYKLRVSVTIAGARVRAPQRAF